MIQTEPDYGEPVFSHSEEMIGDWEVTIYAETYDLWTWIALRNDGVVGWRLQGRGKGLATYDEAKAQCVSALESFTPDGFLPKSYVSTEDVGREVYRLGNGRWVCLLDGVVGEHDFATASLAAAAHKVENYTQ